MADRAQLLFAVPVHSILPATPVPRLIDEIRKNGIPIWPAVTQARIRPAIMRDQSRRDPISDDDMVIAKALAILARRLNKATIKMASSELVENYLMHKLAMEEREIFGALWLDVKNRLIADEVIALGTLSRTVIYPREVVKSALQRNAAGVIFYHNHPTGEPDASENDKVMTLEMKRLLSAMDVRLLDHIIVSGTKTNSFARGGEL